ncbi:hypothetical protein QJS10_CPA06g01178 [Acorus calamus]|uniref:Uncharacterized protein n=1 Tax=Acorus calamus TaxID=4465 RepID=A0AAV9EMF5_ACOCL|nr:hypothetical protein QJS10_CPA06g01178 [Acorus calamus]
MEGLSKKEVKEKELKEFREEVDIGGGGTNTGVVGTSTVVESDSVTKRPRVEVSDARQKREDVYRALIENNRELKSNLQECIEIFYPDLDIEDVPPCYYYSTEWIVAGFRR